MQSRSINCVLMVWIYILFAIIAGCQVNRSDLQSEVCQSAHEPNYPTIQPNTGPQQVQGILHLAWVSAQQASSLMADLSIAAECNIVGPNLLQLTGPKEQLARARQVIDKIEAHMASIARPSEDRPISGQSVQVPQPISTQPQSPPLQQAMADLDRSSIEPKLDNIANVSTLPDEGTSGPDLQDQKQDTDQPTSPTRLLTELDLPMVLTSLRWYCLRG